MREWKILDIDGTFPTGYNYEHDDVFPEYPNDVVLASQKDPSIVLFISKRFCKKKKEEKKFSIYVQVMEDTTGKSFGRNVTSSELGVEDLVGKIKNFIDSINT